MDKIRVTEVLDYFPEPELVSWKINVGKRNAYLQSKKALKVGTRVHELIHQEFTKGVYKFKKDDCNEVRNCLSAWDKFKEHYNPKIISMEEEIQDDIVVGHRDAVVMINDVKYIIDFKTSSALRSKYWIQVAKYYGLSMDCDDICLLRLDKNIAIYEFKTSKDVGFDINNGIKVFDGLLNAYLYFNPNKVPPMVDKEDANGNSTTYQKKRSQQGLSLPKDRNDRISEDW